MAEWRALILTFLQQLTQLKKICKSRGVHQDAEPLPAAWAGRILPLRAVDPTKTTKCQQVEQCPEGTWIEEALGCLHFFHDEDLIKPYFQENETRIRFFLELEGSRRREMVSFPNAGQNNLCSLPASFLSVSGSKM